MLNPREDVEAKKAWYAEYKKASPERKKQMRDKINKINKLNDDAYANHCNETKSVDVWGRLC